MKRGSQLKRRTPLRSGSPKRKAMRRTRKKPTDDPAYLRRVRGMVCCARSLVVSEEHTLLGGWAHVVVYTHACGGPIHAHHATYARRGSLKALDRYTMPLCELAHRQLHELSGPFTGWTRLERRSWEATMVAETQAALGWEGA